MQEKNIIKNRVSNWLANLMYPLGSFIVLPTYFGRIEISGQENIPKTGPIILAPTHRSYWDAIILARAAGRWISGRDLRFMVTKDEYNRPIQGWFIKRMGGYPVDSKNPTSSINCSVELLRAGEAIVIFPEGVPGGKGEFFREGKVYPLKRGLARVALEADRDRANGAVKILPISLKYSKTKPSRRTDIVVKIGKPILVSNYQSDSLRKSSRVLTAVLSDRLTELHLNKQIEKINAIVAV